MPRILGFQSSRYFTISEFANQNSGSANCPKNFAENLANWKDDSFWFKVINFVPSWENVVDYHIEISLKDIDEPLEKCMIYYKSKQRAYIKLGIPI